MNRILTTVISALIISASVLSSFAQEANSLLWRIGGNGLSEPSYLFGTMHLIPKDRFLFNDSMKAALSDCETLALEADIDIPLSEQFKLAKQMLMPDGKTWKDYLNEDDYASVRAAFIDSLGMKESKFENQYCKVRPIYVGGLILTQLLGKVTMYEQELMDMVKKDKIGRAHV